MTTTDYRWVSLPSFSRAAITALGVLVSFTTWAEVRLPALFTDHLVLQRDANVPVWGWAAEGETVKVTFRGQSAKATAQGGKWKVTLKPMKAGGPDTLTVEGKNKIQLKDVLVGEVWIGSGQSNMEWPLRASTGFQAAAAKSSNPRIRLFTVPKLKADAPKDDVQSKWVECGPDTTPGFSAVEYFFGRDLEPALGVPIGLIHTSWGGSPAEVWFRKEALENDPAYREAVLGGYETQFKNFQDAQARFEAAQTEAKAQGRTFTNRAPQRPFWKPAELYNGMIASLIPYAFRGAIWYQGESNAGRAEQYRRLFADMIRNWRGDWGQGDFPFLYVQLAPWDKNKRRALNEITAAPVESDWAELREAQEFSVKTLPKVGFAVITDVGDKDDIHPTDKRTVGERLALAARGLVYGHKIVYSGPIYKSMKVDGNRIVLSFDHLGGGLVAPGGELRGFAIAGEDRKFVWAKAQIEGDTVVVSSPEVAKPVAVRYGWADFPVVNLFNKAGLPASPFRTDNFPMITAGKK